LPDRPPGLLRGGLVAQARRAADRGVADDHAVDLAHPRHADDIVEVVQRQIGRDLEQHRRRTGIARDAVAGLDDPAEQVVEHGRPLQFAQARRVGRGDVDGDVARDRGDLLDQPDIVGGAVGRILVGADVDADDAALPGPGGQPRQHHARAHAVEAEPVDHGLVQVEPEHPGPRIAGLR